MIKEPSVNDNDSIKVSKPNQSIAKWGFGMAPISIRMRPRYDEAVQTGLTFLEGQQTDVDIDKVSELKGMFNRCLRQDQWDWFTVFEELGLPDDRFLRQIPQGLVELRKAVQNEDTLSLNQIRERLIRCNLLTYLYHYQNGLPSDPVFDYGWLYILSTKHQPEILKIGMTKRSVQQRVKEINSVTGVLFPLSARKVFRVLNAKRAEQEIFERLKDARLRPDQEFFGLPYHEAVSIIDTYLSQSRLYNRSSGHVEWFDDIKGFGFIKTVEEDNIFFHRSEVSSNDISRLQENVFVEYEIGMSTRGKFAFNIKVALSGPEL